MWREMIDYNNRICYNSNTLIASEFNLFVY